MSGTPAVFLDRDGTIVHDPGYLARFQDLRWFPYSIDAIRLLKRAGFLVFVLTNQGGIALGVVEETFVHAVHDHLAASVLQAGGRIDGWFYCPHHPRADAATGRESCDCRKPKPGMVQQAQAQFEIDLRRSFVVGDRASDVGLAAAIGATGVLVRTGHGEAELAECRGAVPGASFVAADLMAATAWILTESDQRREGIS
jgi:D-glycero-D-manno-heptose 1,7-bisphosphate phosphatase